MYNTEAFLLKCLNEAENCIALSSLEVLSEYTDTKNEQLILFQYKTKMSSCTIFFLKWFINFFYSVLSASSQMVPDCQPSTSQEAILLNPNVIQDSTRTVEHEPCSSGMLTNVVYFVSSVKKNKIQSLSSSS